MRFSPVQHAVESMALGGPATVMSSVVAASGSAGADDIINGTNALVYRAGDLEGLGRLLDQMLRDENVEEEGPVEGEWSGKEGRGRSSRTWRCELRQRACEDTCMRHMVLHKVAGAIASARARTEDEELGKDPTRVDGTNSRECVCLNTHVCECVCLCMG